MTTKTFHRDILKLDPEKEVERIVEHIRHTTFKVLRRKGGVIGVSGGIDSSLVLALAVRAMKPSRIVSLLLPEMESSPESAAMARELCHKFGTEPLVEDMTGPLWGFGAYQRRDEAIRRVFPEYDSTYKFKITLPSGIEEGQMLNFFSGTIVSPEGEEQTKRLPPKELRQIIASTNFKQRTRASMLYYYADLHDFAVLGTPQLNEHEQGFFVKHGDGAMDVRPIGHLYKTQVFELARYLGVPESICNRPPTTDTYTAGSTHEEFYFRLPFETMDLIWYGLKNEIPAEVVAKEMDLETEQVERIYADLIQKKRTTDYLRTPPIGIFD